ncbi:MAG: hypothetical protein R2715_15865, partial [Ilumatobacteraceae bacterium]
LDKNALERFLRVVDRGVCERLGQARDPLVLACVDYYLPLFQSVTRYPNVVDEVVPGNPEHRSQAELHAQASHLIESRRSSDEHPAIARYRAGVGSGTTVSSVAELAARAREGRIDTMLVSDVPPVWGGLDPETGSVTTSDHASLDVEDLLDRAVFDTLAAGGEVVMVDASSLGTSSGVAATLRY